MLKKNKFFLLVAVLIFLSLNLFSAPFLGGFFYTSDYFTNNKFVTLNSVSYYMDSNFNDYVKLYLRVTGSFKYYTDVPQYQSDRTYTEVTKNDINNFAFIPNIDLFYLEFKSEKKPVDEMLEERARGQTNYDLFYFRIGRVYTNHSSGFVFKSPGDGVDTFFTIKNFSFRLFGITNSFDYLPFFEFFTEGVKPMIFTNWDTKRVPKFTNRLKTDNVDGFISDISTADYNFFFKTDKNDYSSAEKARLNSLRYSSVIAGRVFTGFSFDLMQIYFQNFSLGFLANIDLIPEEFVQTYPKQISNRNNTFGGRYNSFYINLSSNGKIFRGLYYKIEGVYETGVNATNVTSGDRIVVQYNAIHSFAMNAKLSYFFNAISHPTANIEFLYAHGDKDAEFKNDALINHKDFDHSYRSPNFTDTGYASRPIFSNLAIIAISGSVKPLEFLKKPIFSRFLIESALLLYMRPVVEGTAFYNEKIEYQTKNPDLLDDSIDSKIGTKSTAPEKAYLGIEIDNTFMWAVFNDLKLQLKTGVFIPNALINFDADNTPIWRVGLSLNFSF